MPICVHWSIGAVIECSNTLPLYIVCIFYFCMSLYIYTPWYFEEIVTYFHLFTSPFSFDDHKWSMKNMHYARDVRAYTHLRAFSNVLCTQTHSRSRSISLYIWMDPTYTRTCTQASEQTNCTMSLFAREFSTAQLRERERECVCVWVWNFICMFIGEFVCISTSLHWNDWSSSIRWLLSNIYMAASTRIWYVYLSIACICSVRVCA